MKFLQLLVSALVFCVSVKSDLYLHNPRGSNNRLNENTATRTNANRVMDSQNNERGGYNVGDLTDQASGNNEEAQYRMKYFQSGPYKSYTTSDGELSGEGQSYLTLELTNQHGCGGDEDTDPHKTNCNFVIQYMCQDDVDSATGTADTLRNGVDTATQDFTLQNNPETKDNAQNRKNNNVKQDRVLQETWEWYDYCSYRNRNTGLFTADQNLKGDSAIYTRQNPNENRNGYECPEERDYFPYWHPYPWKDAAILLQDTDMCGWYQEESFSGVTMKYECAEYYDDAKVDRIHRSKWNNQEECTANGGDWTGYYNYLEKAPEYSTEQECLDQSGNNGIIYIWGKPIGEETEQCLVALDKPDCMQSDRSRDNHLGNSPGGLPLNYTWTLPYFPSQKEQRCVLRVRYNISTDDYDPYNTDAIYNNQLIYNNPAVDIGADNTALRLAINTAQFGRIFQDRSHVFKLRPRPNVDGIESKRIFNLNVRGKRGNIVQVYPAVEYDFIPNRLYINDGDLVHIQWTGSNTHNNGGNGGDGQAGDEGQGTDGTDRTNIAEISQLLENYPVPYENSTIWKNSLVWWLYHEDIDISNLDPKDLAINMASSGYYKCFLNSVCGSESVETKAKLDNLLNNAHASYEGALLQIAKGIYHYLCTRNNNFTNRSQKGAIVIL